MIAQISNNTPAKETVAASAPLNSTTGFLRLPQILALIPIGRSTWWAGVKSGKFPASVKLSPRVTVWKSEDIQAYIQAQSALAQNNQTQQ
ncbi:MAG: helix-turn-helix transcriptional regulator [Alphaproteobacteria bacterium]